MNHRLTYLAATSFLLATAPAVFAETTIIHAGEMLAIPGKAVRVKQTIVIEDERIVEIRKGYSDPGEFEGEVTVIDLKDQFVLPGLMDTHVHLQGELGPDNDSERLKMSSQQVEMRSVMFGMRTLTAGFTSDEDQDRPALRGPVFFKSF